MESDHEQPSSFPNESLRQTVLKIEGITCEGCATAVSETIRNIPGITDVQIDFQSGQVNVRSPACCTFPKNAVLSAVEKAGLNGRLVEVEAGNSVIDN